KEQWEYTVQHRIYITVFYEINEKEKHNPAMLTHRNNSSRKDAIFKYSPCTNKRYSYKTQGGIPILFFLKIVTTTSS
ncbi:hypothetical protein, partial [Escherichia coli]|uniref:hypothetical protein n=1 Tax=Escherichia coli TaxID=562 RepID=UPI001BAAA705